MSDPLVEAYTNALRAMAGGAPKGLLRRALVEAEDIVPSPDVSEACLREHLATSSPNDRLRLDLHLNLAKWDNTPSEGNPWTCDTAPNTESRRSLVTELLKLDAETAATFAEHLPLFKGDDTTVIAGDWDPWYTSEIQRKRDFYWGHYVDYLLTRRGWGAEAITNLDNATTHVMERLIDPAREKAGQTKGLVVGYVQSGKTANFTGVIAKAIDAGYRLVIVMTGTTNLLREQTQRRLDMELVGRENVLRGRDEADPATVQVVDYLQDEDWIEGRFISHGARPSDIGRPDIHRMTTRNFDYRRLQQGLPALEFERRETTKPLWHPDNLFTSHARLIIVKKNSSVLNNLVKDLKNSADKLEHIPALIIDDESDQASVNTTNPAKWAKEEKNRTAINKHITNLLGMLRRAQYVGYTATPFANVFVDLADTQDIFPKNYLISLQRPAGYMGPEDFHDLDLAIPEKEKTFANSKEKAHVRPVGGSEEESELLSGVDSFVLSGAIKLFRTARGMGEFKHHTMLIHETMRTAEQGIRARYIQDLWLSAGYLSGGAHSRLRELFEQDFAQVSAALGLGLPTPLTFSELEPYLGAVVRKIAPNGNPVLVVNSNPDVLQEELDFDKRPVWRILVGGNKLARGFTVEGLTVTFYSRKVGHAEALMQMGRWFGFRSGYRDLVRLFIPSDVRDALEAACRDEEYFRAELRQYATMVDGRPMITPYDIPPLVIRHGLRPTAANKMYNARLVERRTQTKEPSSGYPKLTEQHDLDHNIDVCVPLLMAAKNLVALRGGRQSFEAFVGAVTHKEMVDVLGRLKWATPETFAADLAWIASLPQEIVDHWSIMLPQQKARRRINIRNVGEFSIHGRKVERGVSIRGNSESVHREALADLPGRTPTSGCAILYPVMNKEELGNGIAEDGRPTGVVMALMLQLPKGAVPADRRPLVYQVVVPGKPLYAIV
ncbi:Z1 domain-containing protein [Micromonospora sp. NPDC005189]|uniref:Z1 domain-containing protein n=1 Tax=Micromonospora sp. NPDC005189 TaxID=3157019 RepID=UPI0033A1CD2A